MKCPKGEKCQKCQVKNVPRWRRPYDVLGMSGERQFNAFYKICYYNIIKV